MKDVKLRMAVEAGYANLFETADVGRRDNARNLAYTVIPRYKEVVPETLAAVRGMDIEAVEQQARLVAETGILLAQRDPRQRISFLEDSKPILVKSEVKKGKQRKVYEHYSF